MLPWDSLFLTKNGHDRYAVLDMEEYRQYEKLMAMQKLMTELEKGRRSGEVAGLLDAAGCARLRELFDELYPRRDRMPVQQELYKALKKGEAKR